MFEIKRANKKSIFIKALLPACIGATMMQGATAQDDSRLFGMKKLS